MADLEKTISIIFAGKDEMSTTMRSIAGELSDFGTVVGTVADPLAGIADSVLKTESALAALAAGGLVYAFNKSKDFESAMIELEKVIGDQPEVLDHAKQKALELSNQYGESSDSIIASMANFKQAGFDVNDSMLLTKTSMDLVIAGNVDAAQSSDLLIAALKGFKAPAEDATRLLDILNEVSNTYATDVEQLGIGMAEISPVAKKMNFSMEETAGILTPVIEIFRSGDEAATALKTGLLKLVDDSKPVIDTLASIGVSQTDANGALRSGKDILVDVAKAFTGLDESQKLFVTQQLVGLDQSARMVEVFDGLSKSAEITAVAMNSSGSAAAEVAARLQGAEVAVNRFGVAFENAAAAVGDRFLEAAKSAIDGCTEIENAIADLARSGAFDPLLDLVRDFAEETGEYLSDIAKALPEAFKSVDFDKLVSSITGLAGEVGDAFASIFGNLDLTKPEDLAAAIQKVIDVASGLTDTARGVLEGMSPLFEAIGIGVEKFSEMDGASQELAGNILGLGKSVSTALSALELLGPAIAALAAGSVANAVTGIASLAGGLGTISTIAVPAGIAAGIAGIGYAGAEAADFIVNKLRPALESIIPDAAIKKLEDFGVLVAEPKEIYTKLTLENGEVLDLITGAITDIDGNVISVPIEIDTTPIEKSDSEQIKNLLLNGATDAEVNFVANPNTENLSRALDAMGVLVVEKTEEVKEVVTETLSWIDEAGNTHELKIPVDASQVSAVKEDLEEIPTEKMLEIKLQGEIDQELAKIKAEADVVQTSVEWRAQLEISQVEAATEQLKTSFDSVNETIESTGDMVQGLLSLLTGDDLSMSEKWRIEDAIDDEMEMRKETFDLQKKLLEQQISINNERLKSLQSGEPQIRIDAVNCSPAVQAVLREIIEQAQIWANEYESNFLLGAS